MSSNHQKSLLDQMVIDVIIEENKQHISEDYKKLNDKCDHIITKIKSRKNKKSA